ncbi:hypothetical protein GW17_00012506 [Ensete ventricosum]|nr:hypothetical protein GW17_00012506 [Ensete ventricosum]
MMESREEKGAGGIKHYSSVSTPMKEEEESSNRQQEALAQLQKKLAEFQARKSTRLVTAIAGGEGQVISSKRFKDDKEISEGVEEWSNNGE